ncbi:MAG TPA: heme ABC transporter ATP-binding protein, partial [Thermoleophilia bacterium]|nr:heme ABC transporter ATP-binding protein [Thermoleophilia bacterium]
MTRAEGKPPALEARGLCVRRSDRTLLEDVDLRVEAGAFLGILGPNGSGKTTLLRALTRAMEPSSGEVLLEGRPVSTYDRRAQARKIGVVPQTFTLDFRFTVEEVVALGRYPHRAAWGGSDDHDDAAIPAAMAALSITDLADRPVTELSGGERQRVLIAQTLAQETPILLLDEPLNNLDLNHQLEVMQVLARLNAEGRTVVVVVHDINMAAQYCAELLLLRGGRVAAHGTPDQLLTPETLLEVFSTRVAVHRQGGRPYVTP